MGSFSIWHWLILLMLAMVLFGGRGKISGIMGDFAHGIRNFREGLKDPNAPNPPGSTAAPGALPEAAKDAADAKRAEEAKRS